MTTYIAGDTMITSLGFTTRENFEQLKAGNTGIRKHSANERLAVDCPLSLVDSERLHELFSDVANASQYTRLEQLAITSVRIAVEPTDIDLGNPGTLFVLATTKGNIDLLGNKQQAFGPERLYLWHTAQLIATHFSNPNPPLVISNACISGVLALLEAHRLLKTGRFTTVVVIGVDIATEFVISGFQSFKSLSSQPCKPYDRNRDGLSLGEGAGTILLTTDPALVPAEKIILRGGASANDANHISGPSRSGEGLYLALEKTLAATGQSRESIGFISAHGTATPYNDDMESQALERAGLSMTPLNSLKGYIGHTLGAAGVLETAAAIRSMREGVIPATKGCETKGTVKEINVIKQTQFSTIDHCLKLASGFGGCNAVILLSKDGTYGL